MSTLIAKNETLLEVALAPLDFVRQVGLVIGFSLLTALAAQIVIPIGPIPITGQTFAVLLTGALLGSRLGAMAMIAYLVEGASGLPFFSGGHGGLLHLMGPTGGYLIAFPAAAFITGAFAEHGWDRKFLTAAAAMAIGSLVIMLSGWMWFSLVMRTSPALTFFISFLKFIPGDIIKIALAAAVLPSGWKLLRR
ncbi:MAG: biotin transporter BioY [Acidobacteria bacterium]|nr:MAG: biotin transporter BioY [Acidobacteriota bacterium]